MNIWHDRKDYVMSVIAEADHEIKRIDGELQRLSGPRSARRVQELIGQRGDEMRKWNKWNAVAWENDFYNA